MTGTTTLALRCSDGVIMATDTRATLLPGFVAHKNAKKVYRITRNMGMTIAGSPAEAQNVLDLLRVNANLYEMQRGRIIPVRAVANLASNILLSQRYYPYAVQVIIGGADSEGYHLFSLDPFGSLIKDDMISTGSGSPVAYGVLENAYMEGILLKEGLILAAKALTATMKRNIYTGDNFNIATITKEEGYMELSEKERKELISSLS